MLKVCCPICNRSTPGANSAEWPDFPFCSRRCRLIDLGRWLDGAYVIGRGSDEEDVPSDSDNEPMIR